MTLLNLPFQENNVFERKHFIFAYVTKCSIFVCALSDPPSRQCPETFFGAPNGPKRIFLLRPKGVFKRPHRTRPDEDSPCTFFESSSLQTHFWSKNTKTLDPTQKKKRSLETQGIERNR